MGINVLVVDQERTFADALAARLVAEGDIEVVGSIQVNMPSLRLIAGKLADVMVLDADMRDEAEYGLCRELSFRDERTRVVMLSSSSKPERIVRAIEAGAVAWVRKDEPLDHLLRVIRGVAQGETWLPPERGR